MSAFDAIMYFQYAAENGCHPKGESLEFDDGIVLGDDWSFSLENKLNITQHTTGAGAGRAQFETFTAKKQVDLSSPDLYFACGTGAHFMGVTVALYKATGESESQKRRAFVIWTFNQLVVEKIEWSHDEVSPMENLSFRFGSCAVSYGKQEATGKIEKKNKSSWNQVANCKDFTQKISNAKSQVEVGA